MGYLNPVMGVAVTSGTNTTAHALSGQASQIMLCSSSTANGFYFHFDSSGGLAAGDTGNFCPGHYPLVINTNHPAYVYILGAASGYVYITEFV